MAITHGIQLGNGLGPVGQLHCTGSYAYASAEASIRRGRDTSWCGDGSDRPLSEYDKQLMEMSSRTGEGIVICASLLAAERAKTTPPVRSLACPNETTMSGLVSHYMSAGLNYAAANAQALKTVRERSAALVGERRR
jgi:hypothetical protein